jgi:hypothetical protein
MYSFQKMRILQGARTHNTLIATETCLRQEAIGGIQSEMSEWNGIAQCVKCGKEMKQSWASWWAAEDPLCDWCRTLEAVKRR